ncbi:RNA polymerase factor sigma-54 [Niallia sp. 01092]|uniref:RNA polymerase factor sigma-54 n=1 Tax=unclassified Niallia TaxID=2837522 RepID=UPI003FD406BF
MNLQPTILQYQKAAMVLNHEMLQTISLLAYSTDDLLDYIREQAMENPLIECEQSLQNAVAQGDGDEFPRKEKRQQNTSEKNDIIENLKDTNGTTLAEFLLEQARLLKINENDYKKLAYFIYSLNENGYLTTSLEEIAANLSLTAEEGRNYLTLLQSLEPTGVGARNLQDCLLLQLKKKYPEDKLAAAIVADYFVLFAEKKWKKIAKELSVDVSAIQEVQMKVLELQPRPGLCFQQDLSLYIRPDVSVYCVNGNFEIQLKTQFFPKFTINEDYMFLLKNKKGKEYEYIHKKYAEFQSLRNGLKQREAILLQVSTIIAQLQSDFFDKGSSKLKPLTLKQVADALGVHESTISRVVANKYMETSFGIIPLKSFFSQGMKGENEKELSSAAVKKAMIDLIKEEDKKHPISDEKIKKLLETNHKMFVSRRVITKYREELNIPSSTRRKQF